MSMNSPTNHRTPISCKNSLWILKKLGESKHSGRKSEVNCEGTSKQTHDFQAPHEKFNN